MRYRVKCRLGGRESAHRYAGSFATRREALARQRWVSGELAAMRLPRIGHRDASASAPTLAEVAERWRASRVDVTEGTAVGHRVQLARVLRLLGSRPIDEITPADVAALVTALHEAGRKRETIRKSLTVLAQVLDFAGIKDNPARDRIHVRLPRQEREEPNPPTAGQIEAVLPLMPRPLRARRTRPRRNRHARRRTRGERPPLRRPRRAEHPLAHPPGGREGAPRPLGLSTTRPVRRRRAQRSRRGRTACRTDPFFPG